mgnify:CR=1 FL=1
MLGWLSRRAENFLALVLAVLFASFLIQIVFRYVLNLPLFGYAFVVRDSDIIRLDIIYDMFPRGGRRALDVITGLICAGLFAWTLPKAWEYIDFMKLEKTAYIRLRFDYVFAIYVPFTMAVIFRSLRSVWRGLTGTGPAFNPSHGAEAHDYD